MSQPEINARDREVLVEMTKCASPAYARIATEILGGLSNLSLDDIEYLIDAYLNDPYLTKFQ